MSSSARLRAKQSSVTSPVIEKSSKKKVSVVKRRAAKKHSYPKTTPKQSSEQLPTAKSSGVIDPSKNALDPQQKPNPEALDSPVLHWPCGVCSCPQGSFVLPVDACVNCEHAMYKHNGGSSTWDPNCEIVCPREELVAATLKIAREKRVAIIRATPQVGKSTLLSLLGRYVLYECPDLEPIWILWKQKGQEGRDGLRYQDYLAREAEDYRLSNARDRPSNPNARPIYLIDEAQNSYLEPEFWYEQIKNTHFTRSAPLFVLVCVYGSAGTLNDRAIATVQSEAIKIDPTQRIELRPRGNGQPHLLFTLEDTITVIKKWAIANDYDVLYEVCEYIHTAAGGHPGMIGLMLRYLDIRFPQLEGAVRHSRKWALEICQPIFRDQEGFMVELERWGRGVWTEDAERFCIKAIATKQHGDIKFTDVIRAMQEAAIDPSGITRPQSDYDAFSFCHRMGFLHTESSKPGDLEVTYVFASPIHRQYIYDVLQSSLDANYRSRVAYRRLFPGPDPTAAPDRRSLFEVCLDAMKGISPSAIQSRRKQLNGKWSVPGAAFQDEMYRCLHSELHCLPIFSEYAHNQKGRVDFFVFDKKWGVEILQCGSKAQIKEHAARFGPAGKYRMWNILDDYIVLNFCPKSKLQELEIEDPELRSSTFHVAVDASERVAEVYTCDGLLKATFTLGERGRSYNSGQPYPDQPYTGCLEEGKQGHKEAFEKLTVQNGDQEARDQALERFLKMEEQDREFLLKTLAPQ